MTPTLEQLSAVIGRIHEAGSESEKWPEALISIMRLIDAQRAALIGLDCMTNRLLELTQVGHDPANARRYSEYYYSVDPTVEVSFTAPALRPQLAYELFPRRFRERHEYFSFARSADIGDVAGIKMRALDDRRYLLSWQRDFRAHPYDKDAKSVLELLSPHIQQALQIQKKLREACVTNAALGAGLDSVAMAAFIVDSQSRVHHFNAPAKRLLLGSKAISTRQARLFFSESPLNATFKAALRAATSAVPRSTVFAVLLADEEKSEVLVAPLRSKETPSGLAFVAVTTGTPDEQSITWRMKQLYGLTPAESRISALLASGRTVEEIATLNRVTEGTLRSQLRSIFGKTGTNRQADLVRLALSGIAFPRG